jgi:hypothetical protein
LFFLATLFPDLIAYAAKIENAKIELANTVSERAVWALFALTGLLSSFPGLKDIDAWLLRTLHYRAAIPEEARLTANILYEAPFAPEPVCAAKVIESLRTAHVRRVASGTEAGELEAAWFKVRCLHEQLKSLLFDDRYREFRRKFEPEFEEIGEALSYQREKLYEFLSVQDRKLPETVADIDGFYEENRDSPEFTAMEERRKKLLFRVQALHYRICLFCSLMVYASEAHVRHVNAAFSRLGFQTGLTPLPRANAGVIIQVMGWVFLAALVPSCIYAFILANIDLRVDETFRTLIPVSMGAVIRWATITVALHATAVASALLLKRYYVRARPDRHSDPPGKLLVEATVIALVCFVLASLILLGVRFARTGQFGPLSLWPILPTITGFFAALYVDRTAVAKGVSHRLAAVQGAAMLVSSVLVCLTLPRDLVMSKWPEIFWIFTAYSSLTAGLIGLTIGFGFQKAYGAECNLPAMASREDALPSRPDFARSEPAGARSAGTAAARAPEPAGELIGVEDAAFAGGKPAVMLRDVVQGSLARRAGRPG